MEGNVAIEKTCAACDCGLDTNPIKVKIGGKTVEVCCDDCSRKLKEAQVFRDGGEERLSHGRK